MSEQRVEHICERCQRAEMDTVAVCKGCYSHLTEQRSIINEGMEIETAIQRARDAEAMVMAIVHATGRIVIPRDILESAPNLTIERCDDDFTKSIILVAKKGG